MYLYLFHPNCMILTLWNHNSILTFWKILRYWFSKRLLQVLMFRLFFPLYWSLRKPFCNQNGLSLGMKIKGKYRTLKVNKTFTDKLELTAIKFHVKNFMTPIQRNNTDVKWKKCYVLSIHFKKFWEQFKCLKSGIKRCRKSFLKFLSSSC